MVFRVSLRESKGRLQLRWTYQGERKFLSLGMYDTPRNRAIANHTIQLIEQDLLHDCYDETLERYKPRKLTKPKPETQKPLTLVDVWNAFDIGHVGSLAFKTQDQYKTFSNHIEALPARFKSSVVTKELAIEIKDYLVKYIPLDTAKRLVTRINAAYNWSLVRGKVPLNPFDGLAKSIKLTNQSYRNINPFSKDELLAIFDRYDNHPAYSKYAPLIKFLALTGCRPEEAIGLKLDNIRDTYLVVRETISYSRGRTIHRDTTKTGRIRRIPINKPLRELIDTTKGDRIEGLLFAINDKPINYAGVLRSWKGNKAKNTDGIVTTLVKDGVLREYRNLYQLRHTFITHALESSQIAPNQLASITGHSVQTLYEHYVGVVNLPQLPTIL